jgi:hypothetical protein
MAEAQHVVDVGNRGVDGMQLLYNRQSLQIGTVVDMSVCLIEILLEP